MSVPTWWEAFILSVGAWRCFQLIAYDDILATPRRYVTDRLSEYWEDFLSCEYCFGAWCAIGWWLAWQFEPDWTLVAATPFALSAGVIAAAKVLSAD